jgi:hypothetical protein
MNVSNIELKDFGKITKIVRRTSQAKGIIDFNSGGITFYFENDRGLSFEFSDNKGVVEFSHVDLPPFYEGDVSFWLEMEEDYSACVLIEMPVSALRNEIYGKSIEQIIPDVDLEFGLQGLRMQIGSIECAVTVDDRAELYTKWRTI